MKKVLITGGSGLLGVNWSLAIKDNYHVVLGLHSKNVTLEGIDTIKIHLEDIKLLEKEIDSIKPDVVVHAAGMTSVEQCEQNYIKAERVNCTLSKNIAVICEKKNIKLIHISTDHLYDGSKKNVTEKDIPNPINVYGKTKLQAERAVSEACPLALIIRTNFFGWGGPYKRSFSDWIIDNLRAEKEIQLFDDVFYTPIIIDKLALSSMRLVVQGVSGVVNIIGDERISKFEFAQKIVMQFDLPLHLIIRDKISSAKFLTQRPRDMSLSNDYVTNLLGEKLGAVDDCIYLLKQQESMGQVELINKAFK